MNDQQRRYYDVLSALLIISARQVANFTMQYKWNDPRRFDTIAFFFSRAVIVMYERCKSNFIFSKA